MAAKRIYQLAKEFERDEKEIIAFLTSQGIKVANRLSAVSEDTYNLLKVKYTAPPEPEPVPEPPKPEPPAQPETPAASAEDAAPAKKKNKKKSAQPAEGTQSAEQSQDGSETPAPSEATNATVEGAAPAIPANIVTQLYRNAAEAGSAFIKNYHMNLTKKQLKATKVYLSRSMDTWALIQDIPVDNPDASPANYWQAVNKLTTKAFKLMNQYGMSHREILAEMRNLMRPIGLNYEPSETLSDEENQIFDEQRQLFFRRFGHGMGKVNDNLFALKMYAENMKARYELMDFVEYVTNPDDPLRSKNRVPFMEIADEVTFSIKNVARRVHFYEQNKERIINIIKNFFEWRDGYAKLKEQGAPADKLENYLALEKKFADLVEFMSFDNLLFCMNKKVVPFDSALELLNNYRDNMDDPDAKRNFQYKIRGITQIIFKPKEFVFLYQLAELESGKDYRPPEEIAAAEAKAAAEAAAEADSSDTAPTTAKENPADSADEVADK